MGASRALLAGAKATRKRRNEGIKAWGMMLIIFGVMEGDMVLFYVFSLLEDYCKDLYSVSMNCN